MGSKETQYMYIRTCIDRSVLVALSALPPGVNELCVCVCTIWNDQNPGSAYCTQTNFCVAYLPRAGWLILWCGLAPTSFLSRRPHHSSPTADGRYNALVSGVCSAKLDREVF